MFNTDSKCKHILNIERVMGIADTLYFLSEIINEQSHASYCINQKRFNDLSQQETLLNIQYFNLSCIKHISSATNMSILRLC